MGSQRFCLRWNNHQSNLLSVFDQLLHDEAFVDVTLAVEGQFLRAHKMVLSACSPYFQTLFVGHPDKHPIVILKDVPYADMRSLLDFMYRGEVSVDQDRLTAFLKVAESLRIKGLTEVNEERCDLPSIASSLLSSSAPPPPPPPPPHLHRIHHVSGPKRSLPPMAANPLLGSALTAPKRKRGRPRKLSGCAPDNQQPGHPGSGPGLSNDQDHDQSGGPGSPSMPNRTDSPMMVHGAPGPNELLEVNMGEFHDDSPSSAGGGVGGHASKEDEQSGSMDDTPGSAGDEPGGQSGVKKEHHEPTPSTSMHDNSGNFKQGSQDGERFTPVTISMEKQTGTSESIKSSNVSVEEEEEDSVGEGGDECYEDMIACSPAGSSECEEVDEEEGEGEHEERLKEEDMDNGDFSDDHKLAANNNNGGVRPAGFPSMVAGLSGIDMTVIKREREDYLDEDISQYEMDSFRSMMTSTGGIMTVAAGGQIGSQLSTGGFSPNKPIDKASVRRYCTHEAENVYRCNVCAKTYTHISNFCRHFLSAHHGVRQEIPCPVCFKLFTRKDNMMTHTKQVHRLALMRGSTYPQQDQPLQHLQSDNNASPDSS